MRTIRRLLYREILGATLMVMAAFLGLFFFIDMIGELENLGRPGASTGQALLMCLLQLPGHVYELAPIAVLIGSIYALARLAQSSEFTILRTGGLGPGRALSLLTTLGLALAAVTFVVGDYLAPWADTQAALQRSRHGGALTLGQAQGWLIDRAQRDDGEHRYTVNFAVARSHEQVEQVRIFEFGPRGDLLTRTTAARALIGVDGTWALEDVHITHWRPAVTAPGGSLDVRLGVDEHHANLAWSTHLPRDVVAAAVLPLSTMSTTALYRYMNHLADHAQAAQRYEIQFWKKVLYPLACLVMLGLALPFAYLHARSGGLSLKVFGGIMLGISFVLLNSVSSHLGLLNNWTPWLAATAPSLIYLLMSLAAFSWLVRYR